MKFHEFKELVKSDLYRYIGYNSKGALIRYLIFDTWPAFKYSFWMRFYVYLMTKVYLISFDLSFIELLGNSKNETNVPEMFREALADNQIKISEDAKLKQKGRNKWLISDKSNRYIIKKKYYLVRRWKPSRLIIYGGFKVVKRYFIFPFFLIVRMILTHYKFKYGIYILTPTKIGKGLMIGHFGGIIIAATIGDNLTIPHNVTIGQAGRDERKGIPIIGDNVYIGSGARIIGKIRIGNNVAIGANCVVTKDIPDNAVVVGIPGKIISYKGSHDYIQNPYFG